MAYNFEEIKHFYLRKYLVEFNDIVLNTPQDDFTQFLNSLKKSKDYIRINTLLKTIQILDKLNLQKSDIEERRSLILKENPSMKDKTTKVIVNNLNCILSNKIPKLFKSHNTNIKKAYIKNTFTKLKSTINQLLNKEIEIMKLFNLSLKEYNSALIIGKTRTSLYMINIAHYLYLKPYSAFDFSNHYLGKGNSSKIKKNISFKDIENSFYDLQFTLFPNYQLYNHTKDAYVLGNEQFYKQALKMLLEDAHKFAPYNNQTEIINESELNRKSEAYHFKTCTSRYIYSV